MKVVNHNQIDKLRAIIFFTFCLFRLVIFMSLLFIGGFKSCGLLYLSFSLLTAHEFEFSHLKLRHQDQRTDSSEILHIHAVLNTLSPKFGGGSGGPPRMKMRKSSVPKFFVILPRGCTGNC